MSIVAIFHSGEITINAYYLAAALKQQHIDVQFYLYTPRTAYKHNYLVCLLRKVKDEFRTFELKGSFFASFLTKPNRLFEIFGTQLHALIINPLLPGKTKKLFDASKYTSIITIGQASLYWLYKTDPQALNKAIHYSLEIQLTSDPYFITPQLGALINWESSLLKKAKGLIIQDVFRAEALLNCKLENSHLKFFFLPVALLGKTIRRNEDYLYHELKIPREKKILLYFGALYSERYIKEVTETFDKSVNDNWVLVLHGPNNFSSLIPDTNKIKASHNLLDYEDLYKIICSATIGLALYDNRWPNTRFTAFSSEKIARYLQAGVPFIAFKNESYIKLKGEFNCCALIIGISDLNDAIEEIMENYDVFRENCFKAYDKHYNISNSILPLSEFVNNISNSAYV